MLKFYVKTVLFLQKTQFANHKCILALKTSFKLNFSQQQMMQFEKMLFDVRLLLICTINFKVPNHL